MSIVINVNSYFIAR